MSDPTDTLHLSNLDDRTTQRILYELCIQAGPIKRITINDSGRTAFAFVQYQDIASSIYAYGLLRNHIQLFGRLLNVNFSKRGASEVTLTPEQQELFDKALVVSAPDRFDNYPSTRRSDGQIPYDRSPHSTPGTALPFTRAASVPAALSTPNNAAEPTPPSAAGAGPSRLSQAAAPASQAAPDLHTSHSAPELPHHAYYASPSLHAAPAQAAQAQYNHTYAAGVAYTAGQQHQQNMQQMPHTLGQQQVLYQQQQASYAASMQVQHMQHQSGMYHQGVQHAVQQQGQVQGGRFDWRTARSGYYTG